MEDFKYYSILIMVFVLSIIGCYCFVPFIGAREKIMKALGIDYWKDAGFWTLFWFHCLLYICVAIAVLSGLVLLTLWLSKVATASV